VSFGDLSEQSWKFAQGLGMANGEFVKLEGQANAASGGAYRTPEDLARATRGGVDLSRAYGLDPSQGVGFVAGMQRLNSHQNNKELATQLAHARHCAVEQHARLIASHKPRFAGVCCYTAASFANRVVMEICSGGFTMRINPKTNLPALTSGIFFCPLVVRT
jgi:hypothetical protein